MSSLALMRWLESAPDRYDAGMRWLTLGRAARLQEALAAAAAPEPGLRVLEIGCGTGALTALLVARGARVTAVDQDPAMLEIAHRRLEGASVVWLEQTAAEIDGLPAASFDAVASSFVLSEMSRDERRFVLRAGARCLAPGGRLVVGDEVWPRGAARRLAFRLARAPQSVLGWLLAGSVSAAVPDLVAEVRETGLAIDREERWLGGSLALVCARAGEEGERACG